MRLIALKPVNFRAFGNPGWIDLDSDLVVFFGSNGVGKTSLAEAVEWLLYGQTLRRKRGDGFSKLEHKGSYANLHAHGPVEVSARVRLRDGSVKTLTRRMSVGSGGAETSQTFLDGRPDGWPFPGMAAGEAHYPVITQHGLQDFIHLAPKDRREAISLVLGMETVAAFKSALDRARIALHRTPLREVAEAQSALAGLRGRMMENGNLARLAGKWQEDLTGIRPQADVRLLIAAAQKTLGVNDVDPERLAAGLEARREQIRSRVLDVRKLRLPADLAERMEELRDQAKLLVAAVVRLREVLAAASVTTSPYPPDLLAFWEKGLRLVESWGSCQCPMCRAALPWETLRDLKNRIARSSTYLADRRRTMENAAPVRNLLGAIRRNAAAILPPAFDDETRGKLAALLPESTGEVLGVVAARDALQGTWKTLDSTLTEQELWLEHLSRQDGDPEELSPPPGDVEWISRATVPLVQRLAEEVQGCASRFASVERAVAKQLFSVEEVRGIDVLIAGLRARQQMRVVSRHNGLREELSDLSRALEGFLQERQSALLADKNEQIQRFYDLMNPGSPVRFLEMEPASGSTRLYAESFGEKLSAPACLSTSQLNCLGLSFYLMSAISPESPFDFLLMDDPFQAMDADHCESFITAVIPLLVDSFGKQVIVLTHDANLAGRMGRVNGRRRPLQYRLERSGGKWPFAGTYSPSPLVGKGAGDEGVITCS